MGITHNGTKVSIIPRSHNTWTAMGSSPATRSHVALPAVLPLPLATLRFAGSTAGYSVITLWVRRFLYSNTWFCWRPQIFLFFSDHTIGYVFWHYITFIDKQYFLLTATYGFDFIVYIIIEMTYLNVINEVNSSFMSLLLFIAIPAYGIANFESWGRFHFIY